MFDFGNSNNGQKEAISSANDPVLITAGPGTGKTYTLVQRAIYLIEECGVQPENLFIATFTEKAAKELITRITNELARRNITANVNEMYVGTFHSLCLRILKENLEYTRLKKNYRLLDAFDQKYTVFQNIYQFRNIPNVDAVLPDSGAWKQSEAICGYVNNLSEELVSPDDLERDVDPAISAMGTILRTYQKLLNDNNLMDFSSIQVETYRLLTEHSEILEELQTKITHLMVDEYQDTNYIQLAEFNFKPVKDVNIKRTFAFTSNITVYDTCALQYKFYKELEFMPVRANAMLFGTLVHETIEDIHRAAIRHEESEITHENIEKWFDANYSSLSKTEHSYLAAQQLEAALKQVIRYADRQHGNWSTIQQAEVDVSLVKPDYIIDGKIDLIKGEGDTVEIVDFKSERKPDLEKSREKLEQYRRQLNIYAYLVEERTGKKVSRMNLYYTGEENGVPVVTFPYTKTAIEGTMAAFDDTVQHILKKDFHHCANDEKICKNCDFKYFCRSK